MIVALFSKFQGDRSVQPTPAQPKCVDLGFRTVEDGLRTGEDPRTGKVPRTDNARLRLREYLKREAPRLATSYGDVLA